MPCATSLVEHEPLIYSVGGDYEDDGGAPAVPPMNPHGPKIDKWRTRKAVDADRLHEPDWLPDGDWILYPPSLAQ